LCADFCARWLFKLGGEGQNVDARVFKWTGKNHYFALCESDFISFGGGYVCELVVKMVVDLIPGAGTADSGSG
jgi:hypothetical protein